MRDARYTPKPTPTDEPPFSRDVLGDGARNGLPVPVGSPVYLPGDPRLDAVAVTVVRPVLRVVAKR